MRGKGEIFFFILITAMLFVFLPRQAKEQKIIVVQKRLIIKASRWEPPRIAFDELFPKIISEFNEFEVLKQNRASRNLNIDLINSKMNRNPLFDLKVKKFFLKPMILSYDEAKKVIDNSLWEEALTAQQQERLRLAKIEEPLESGLMEIKGTIQLDSGLPVGGGYNLILKRYENGIPKETGYVDPINGNYSIQVTDLSGSLKAQIIHDSGQVIGEGVQRISQENSSENSQETSTAIIVKKNQNQVVATGLPIGSLISDYGIKKSKRKKDSIKEKNEKLIETKFYSPSFQQEILSDELGVLTIGKTEKGSKVIVESKAAGYYPTVQCLLAGEEVDVPLFPERMIKALREIYLDSIKRTEFVETDSIVWGRVVQNNKPLAGVTVKINNFFKQKPIYFNNILIPDFSAASTNENGYFVIMGLPEGLHDLKFSLGSKNIGHENVLVTSGAISPIVIETDLILEPVDVKVFDSFSGEPAAALVDLQNNEGTFEVEGVASVLTSATRKLTKATVRPTVQPQYLDEIDYYFNSGEEYIHLPLIKTQWVEEAKKNKNLEIEKDAATIVGFVPNIDFQVFLPHEEKYLSKNIIYFDATGKIIERGIAGGGFILFNVPVGVQSIVLQNTITGNFLSEVIEVFEKRTTVLKF